MSRDILVRVGEDDKPVGYPTPAIDKLVRTSALDLNNDLLLVHRPNASEAQKEQGVTLKTVAQIFKNKFLEGSKSLFRRLGVGSEVDVLSESAVIRATERFNRDAQCYMIDSHGYIDPDIQKRSRTTYGIRNQFRNTSPGTLTNQGRVIVQSVATGTGTVTFTFTSDYWTTKTVEIVIDDLVDDVAALGLLFQQALLASSGIGRTCESNDLGVLTISGYMHIWDDSNTFGISVDAGSTGISFLVTQPTLGLHQLRVYGIMNRIVNGSDYGEDGDIYLARACYNYVLNIAGGANSTIDTAEGTHNYITTLYENQIKKAIAEHNYISNSHTDAEIDEAIGVYNYIRNGFDDVDNITVGVAIKNYFFGKMEEKWGILSLAETHNMLTGPLGLGAAPQVDKLYTGRITFNSAATGSGDFKVTLTGDDWELDSTTSLTTDEDTAAKVLTAVQPGVDALSGIISFPITSTILRIESIFPFSISVDPGTSGVSSTITQATVENSQLGIDGDIIFYGPRKLKTTTTNSLYLEPGGRLFLRPVDNIVLHPRLGDIHLLGDTYHSGNLGVGSVPDSNYRLVVNGNTKLAGARSIEGTSTTTLFTTGNTNQLRLNTSGNVAIGRSVANSRLDVNGGVRIGDDDAAAAQHKVGTIRHRIVSNVSKVEICIQTGVGTFEWATIL